jgi:hypothetical protein
VAALCTACALDPPAQELDPRLATALELLELARLADPPPEELLDLVTGQPDDLELAALFDALTALAAISGETEPELVRIEELAGLDRCAVDLRSTLPGGGSATFSIQLESTAEGWKVSWFGGPGFDWPSRRPPRGEGLTTSDPRK